MIQDHTILAIPISELDSVVEYRVKRKMGWIVVGRYLVYWCCNTFGSC